MGEFEKFAEAATLGKEAEGPKMFDHVLKGLPKDVQDEEMDSVLYKQEEKYFEQLALIVFDEVLVSSGSGLLNVTQHIERYQLGQKKKVCLTYPRALVCGDKMPR